jgi:putative NADH-flavin reductase
VNLTVLGAAGGTGILVVRQALAGGHSVTALVRSPGKMTLTDPRLRVVEGDATDQAAVARALAGSDAVISTLDAPGPIIAEATRAILSAADRAHPPRVVMMSSFAVQRDRLKGLTGLLTAATTGAKMKDKVAGESALRASDLRWTIVYATLLTNGPAQGARVVPESDKVGMSDRISRADAASFLLEAATTGAYDRRSVLITGGSSP